MTRWIAIAFVVLVGSTAHAGLIDALATDDPKALAAAVTAIEQASAGTPELADALFAAARACEERLVEPARALALYERIERELPDARVVIAASRRAAALRAQMGSDGQYAALATTFAKLVARANELDVDEVVRQAMVLVEATWPGAPEVGLWLADWFRRAGRFDEAQQRYADVAARFSGHASVAIRGAAGCAIEAREWDRAEELAEQLPAIDAMDRIVRDDLLAAAARGRTRARWYMAAWFAVVIAFGVLASSLLESALRGGWRMPHLWPPSEVVFLAPVAAVLVGVALTTHQLIAPAVLMLSIGGLVLAWISGAALETARARGREIRTRAVMHAVVSGLAVLALLYIAITREDLLDMVIETVRFGPE